MLLIFLTAFHLSFTVQTGSLIQLPTAVTPYCSLKTFLNKHMYSSSKAVLHIKREYAHKHLQCFLENPTKYPLFCDAYKKLVKCLASGTLRSLIWMFNHNSLLFFLTLVLLCQKKKKKIFLSKDCFQSLFVW